MISVAPEITTLGKALITRAVGGETITFTKFQAGNGAAADDPTELSNALFDFGITDINTSSAGSAAITGIFDSSYVETDFSWTEIGLFCKGEDDVEILLAYANDSDNAGVIKTPDSGVVVEQTVTVVIAIGDAESVTAELVDSAVYITKEAFAEHTEDTSNPHSVTAKQIGLENVENVAVNDAAPTYTAQALSGLVSGETLSVAFGKLKTAVSNLISHLSDKSNPHGVDLTTIGAAAAEHTHSTADITSGTLSIARGGTGVSSLSALKELIQTYETLYPTTGTVVGEWVDGNDIVRVMFSRALSDTETANGYVTAADLISGESGGDNEGQYYMIASHVMFLETQDGVPIPQLIDDRYVTPSEGNCYIQPTAAHDWIYGYIDFVKYSG